MLCFVNVYLLLEERVEDLVFFSMNTSIACYCMKYYI